MLGNDKYVNYSWHATVPDDYGTATKQGWFSWKGMRSPEHTMNKYFKWIFTYLILLFTT